MKVFLSYSREDIDVVRRVAEILRAHSYDVFIDHDIAGGDNFREQLVTQLHAADCILTFWSDSAVNSRWVIDEAGYGLDRGILVPILLDNINPPFGFGDVNAANLSDRAFDVSSPNIQKVLKAVKWITSKETDSIIGMRAGLNRLLDPLPAKDLREFKSLQTGLNEILAEAQRQTSLFQRQVAENSKESNLILQETSIALRKTMRRFEYVIYPLISLFALLSIYAFFLFFNVANDFRIIASSFGPQMNMNLRHVSDDLKHMTLTIDNTHKSILILGSAAPKIVDEMKGARVELGRLNTKVHWMTCILAEKSGHSMNCEPVSEFAPQAVPMAPVAPRPGAAAKPVDK